MMSVLCCVDGCVRSSWVVHNKHNISLCVCLLCSVFVCLFDERCLRWLKTHLIGSSKSQSSNDTCVCVYCVSEDQLPAGFPTIDMGPQLKVVERTRTATMLCAASGNPDPDISWFKDFLPVNTSTNNGRIKQLRSGNDPLTQQNQSNHTFQFCLMEFFWFPLGNDIVFYVPCVCDVSVSFITHDSLLFLHF